MDQDWLAVFESLSSVYIKKAYSNIAVNEAVSRHKGARESFVRTFAKGVIRDTVRLDYIINSLASRGIGSIKSRPLIIIRMGMYAIDSLGSVPDHAAVNEAVRLSKSVAKGSDRFVNGILREYIRQADSFSKESLEPDIRYSFTEPVFSLLTQQYGREAFGIADALNQPPQLYIRINKLRTDREYVIRCLKESGFDAEASEDVPEAVAVSGSGIVSHSLYRDGYISVQSISSMMAVRALNPESGSRVLDLCAAPGGKSGYMAELMGNKGSITACDIHPHRLKLMEAAFKRTGVSIAGIKEADASLYDASMEASYDYVAADVPCSGLGVIGSKPEIKLTADPSSYDRLIELQKKILDNALHYVKSGGRVMYSTCTLNKNENENVVKQVLSKTSTLTRIIEMHTILPYNGKVGFFYCIIEKNVI